MHEGVLGLAADETVRKNFDLLLPLSTFYFSTDGQCLDT